MYDRQLKMLHELAAPPVAIRQSRRYANEIAAAKARDRVETERRIDAVTVLEQAGTTGWKGMSVAPDPIDLPPTVSSIDRPRIVLADDDAVMCEYLQQLLSQSYQVEIAADGVEAMRAIDRQQPDLVLTDVVMPNLDGLELLRSIRANQATQDIPVILLSAYDSEESRIAGLEAGADDYLVKPFSARELVARVDATLRLARLRLNADNRERALQQETVTAKANLDRIVTNLNNGFATFDRQWRYTYANNRLLEIFNLPRADVLGKQAWEVFPNQVGIRFYDLLKRAMNERSEEQFEYYYEQIECWVEHRVYPTDDGLAILMADVSDRKRAELLSIEQTKLLELAASGKPLDECLAAVCTSLSALNNLRACILLTDPQREQFSQCIAPLFGASFALGIEGAPIDEQTIGTYGRAVFDGETVTCRDIANDDRWSPFWQNLYLEQGCLGCHAVPIIGADELPLGSLMLCFGAARLPTDWEYRLADFGVHIASIVCERERKSLELRESEIEYRTLFESIDEGFCIVEMLFDAQQQPVDYRFEQVNPAFFSLTGLPADAVGKTMRQLVPDLEDFWMEIYGKVALTGESMRFENHAVPMNRWFDVYASRVGDDASRRVAIVFTNITERKQAEEISQLAAKFDAFRIALADALRPLTSPVEIQATASRVLGEYLGANRVLYFEIRGTNYFVERDYVNGAMSLHGSYPIDSFSPKMLAAQRAGHTMSVSDVAADTDLSPEQKAAYAAIQVGAHIDVPLVKGGEFIAGLTVHTSAPREWTSDELNLAAEVAERTWAAIERARAEAEVAANLGDTQLLRELGARLVSEDDSQTLYGEILAAAIDLTGADAGTLQILDEQTQDLCLISSQGFESSMTTHFARVDASSDTSCGIALCSGIRMFVDFDAPHPDPCGSMRLHVDAGLLSAQSTPLISRTGKPIGMVSTHWRTCHRSSDSPKERLCQRQLQFLDLLARQAADTIEQRQTTAALRDREEQLRLATDASKLGMWFWNLETDTLAWTEQCKAIFGLPADTEMSYEVFQAALHPDDRQRTHAAVTRSMAERTDYDIEYRSCWPDGTIHWIAAKGSCTYNTAGTPIQMLGVAIDITERKRVEEALRHSEAQLAVELADMQQLQQISSQLISEDNIDALYQQIVDAAIALMDADLGTLYTIDPDRHQLRLLASRGLHPTAAEHWQSVSLESNTVSGKTAATGEPTFISDVESCNLPFGTVDLDCARLSGIKSVHSTPLVSRNGRIVGTICTQWRTPHQPSVRRLRLLDVLARQVADLLDRKQVEESLRESQTRLRFMLDASEIGEWDLDLTTKPHTAHRSLRHDQIFGYESLLSEWSYEIFLTHVHPDDRAAIDENFQQTLADHTAWNFECRIVHPDRSIHWIWVRSSVYCDSNGTPIRLLGMVVDFTDRKQAEESLAERARELADLNSRLAQSEIQLQERNQELNSFVHIVSHDLKAPLRAVANLSQWIEEDFEGTVSANTTEQMNLLRGRIYRMESMIDGLLQYARVGRQDTQLELVPVADLLTEVIESIAPPPTFEIDIAAQMPTLAANRLLVSQVFANLISNAFKHHDRSDGSIRISSREVDDCYEFAICDDGPGIAPEYRDRVFVIFQAANPQKNPDSTGIGLSIVKKIVETAGGQIWLESELGRGTTFYFTWPNRSVELSIV